MKSQHIEEETKSTGAHSHSGQGSDLDSSQLSNIELIRKAEECVDKLKLEKAVALYDEGIRRWPNDTLILDQYSDLLIQFGELKKAGELIQRSIQLNPNRDGQKYLNAAEMLSGHEAVQIYRKGIQVLDLDHDRLIQAQNHSQAFLVKRQTASALASIAELYMTVPLCDEPNAEQTCEQCLQDALQRDPVNLDALQALSNLRILRDRDGEAKELLKRVVEQTFQLQAEHKKTMTVGEIAKGKQKSELNEMPSTQFRLQTSRHLVELQMDKQAIKMLEGVVNEDDEQIEAWYLLAFVLHRMGKFSTCLECANNVVALAQKLKVKDAELLAGTDEIIKDCKKKIDKAENVQVVDGKDDDDSGFETMSEEEIGSSGGDSDVEMKE